MKYIKNTTWDNVFASWRQREASNPGWIKTATEIKGWPDWESWRKFTASQLGLEMLDWNIYEFINPLLEIPDMLIGPYSGWQSRVAEKNKSTFADLLNNSEQYNFFKSHDTVSALLKDFPKETEFIGLLRKDLNKVVLIEGHHRAVAVAILNKDGKVGWYCKVRIALSEINENEQQLFDTVLERGTSKIDKANHAEVAQR